MSGPVAAAELERWLSNRDVVQKRTDMPKSRPATIVS
jgi:hypothetical protein